MEQFRKPSAAEARRMVTKFSNVISEVELDRERPFSGVKFDLLGSRVVREQLTEALDGMLGLLRSTGSAGSIRRR